MALTRVNALFIIYHFRTPDGRGPGGDRSRPEESQLSLTLRSETTLPSLCSLVLCSNIDQVAGHRGWGISSVT